MTTDRTRLIAEARQVLRNYHGDPDADDVTLIDAIAPLVELAGLTYLVNNDGTVTLETSRPDQAWTELREALDGVKKASPDWIWEIDGLWSEDEKLGVRTYLAASSPAKIRALLDEIDRLRAKVETKTLVAESYREALGDTYRPHAEQNAILKATIAGFAEAADNAEAALDRVRALHVRRTITGRTCGGCGNPYPCTTIRALEVESRPATSAEFRIQARNWVEALMAMPFTCHPRDEASALTDRIIENFAELVELLGWWPHLVGPEHVRTVEELQALPAGTVLKLPDGEVGMIMQRIHPEKVCVLGYPGTMPTDELHEVIRAAHGDPLTILHRPTPKDQS